MKTEKIEILMQRDAAERLHAFVLERHDTGQITKGPDLLAERMYRNISAAVFECDRHIHTKFKGAEPPKIEYIFGKGAREQ